MTQVINTDKGLIEFSMEGTGTPMLFVHGGHSSCNEKLFHQGFDGQRFCLITPSRPGYGNTPLTEPGSARQTAELFVALLDVLKLPSVIVVGISAGGLSALELAAHFPERVDKLLLIAAVTQKWMTPADETYQKAKKIFSPAIEKYSWAAFRFCYAWFPKLMAATMFKELSTYRPCNISKEEAAELYDMIKRQRSKKGFVNDLEQDIDPCTMAAIRCPTMILHSANDNSVRMEHATHAKSGIRNAILKIYHNKWGHLLWLGKEREAPLRDALRWIG